MKILLLNKNPIISKLVKLTAAKLGDEFEELGEFSEQKADIIIVDSDEKLDLSMLKGFCSKIIFLNKKGEKAPEDSEILSIYKPFLPTELVKIIEQASATQGQILDENNIKTAAQSSVETKAASLEPQAEAKETAEVPNESGVKDTNSEDDELDLSALDLENESKEEEQENSQQSPNVKQLEEEKETIFEPEADEKKGLELKEQDENFNEHDLDEVFKMSEDEKAVHMPEAEEDEEAQNQKVDEVLDVNKMLEQESVQGESVKNEVDETNLPETLETEDFDSLLENLDLQDEPSEPETAAQGVAEKEPEKEFANEPEVSTNEPLKEAKERDKDELLKDFELSLENLDREIEDKKEPQNELSFALDEISNASQSVAESKNVDEKDEKATEKQGVSEPSKDFEFSVEEQKDKELSFDDLPKDAKFIGQSAPSEPSLQEPSPQISEPESKENVSSTHESIKEQLKEIDEMDKAAIEKQKVEATKALKDSELDKIKERDIKVALGESVVDLPPEELEISAAAVSSNALSAENSAAKNSQNAFSQNNTIQNNASLNAATNEEIISELGKSITSAITSSINDETLKAALKGMNMNINISINFDEDKH